MDEVLGYISPEYFERHLKPVILQNYRSMVRHGRWPGWCWASKVARKAGFVVSFVNMRRCAGEFGEEEARHGSLS